MKKEGIPINPKLNRVAMDALLPFIEVCPHTVKPEIGAADFVEDLNTAAAKIHVFSPEIYSWLREFLPFVKVCPHIFSPGIGLAAFADELILAIQKFESYTKEKNIKDTSA